MKIKKASFFGLLIPLLFSCSLDYLKSDSSESTTPEFIFSNANFTRYETGIIKIKMKAEKIEQYKSDGSTYAKHPEFDSFDSDGKPETSGKCGLLEANSNTERYKLFEQIYLNMISQKMEITAETLCFDKKSEQLTSDMNSTVSLKKDDFEVSGSGFSASGVSKSFVFEESVEGTITTDEKADGNDNESTSDGEES